MNVLRRVGGGGNSTNSIDKAGANANLANGGLDPAGGVTLDKQFGLENVSRQR